MKLSWIEGRTLALLALLGAGCAPVSPTHSPYGQVGPAARVRLVTAEDLGLSSGPLPLDVVYSIHPGLAGAAGHCAGPLAEVGGWASFRRLTRCVLEEAFRTAVEISPGSHVKVEALRQTRKDAGEEVPLLSARALVLVDFRPSRPGRRELGAQLSVQLLDISFPRYEAVALHQPRLLIFQDVAELPAAGRGADLSWPLVLAWREVLRSVRESDRCARYLEMGNRPLSESEPQGAFLFGMVPAKVMPRVPDPSGHEWIEQQLLFPQPRPVDGGPAAAPPASAAAATPPVERATGEGTAVDAPIVPPASDPEPAASSPGDPVEPAEAPSRNPEEETAGRGG